MKLRKLVRTILALLLVVAVVTGLIAIDHPIILKWIAGNAKHHGKPMPASVYVNGKSTGNIKVFYADEPNTYLLTLNEQDGSGLLQAISIDLDRRWIGRSVARSSNDYDIIAGHLFQSKTAPHFASIQDEVKDAHFDHQLSFTGKQVRFYMLHGKVIYDTVRIELP